MPYRGMRGDYYTGDYYMMGDPGIFGAIGRGIKRVGGRLIGAISGIGPVARVARALPAGIGAGRAAAIMKASRGAIAAHPRAAGAAAGAAGAIAAALGIEALQAPTSFQRGFHVSRTTGQLVRNRRMRVTNVKALHRSLRRIGGFARVARRVLHFTHPRAARGKPRFKFRKKARAM